MAQSMLQGKGPLGHICPECGAVFTRLSNMKRHVSKFHPHTETDDDDNDDEVIVRRRKDFVVPKKGKLVTPKVIKDLSRKRKSLDRLKKHLPLLQYLRRGKKGVVQMLINEADRDIINVLCECASNTLCGNVTTTKSQIKQLIPYKRNLRKLIDHSTPLRQKKRILTQKGGIFPILPLLLKLAVPAVTGLIGAATARR